MFSKEGLYQFEQDLVNDLGFAVPFNNIKLQSIASGQSTWNFDPITNKILACKPQNCTPEQEAAILEFSMAHEICHMIQSFVMKSDLNKEKVANLSPEEYSKLLNKFFGVKNININEQHLNKFKNFIKNCPFMERESLNALKFDDFYYVSGNPASLYDKVYHHNATEIYANHFASSFLYTKYKREGNKSIEFMRAFGDKIKERTSYLISDRKTITKSEFEEQMQRAKPKWQRNIIRFMNIFGQLNELSPIYKNHDFINTVIRLNSIVKSMEMIQEEIPQIYRTQQEIEEEIKEKEKCRNTIEKAECRCKVTVLDNFEPGSQNDGRYCVYPKDDYDTLSSYTIANSYSTFAKEIVVDLNNKDIYVFHDARLDKNEMRESESLLDFEDFKDKLDKLTEVAVVGLQWQTAR